MRDNPPFGERTLAFLHRLFLGFLVDLDGSLRLVEREGVRVDWSENVYDPLFNEGAGATDFERNMLRFRAEGRWDLQIQRPRGIVEFPTEAPTP